MSAEEIATTVKGTSDTDGGSNATDALQNGKKPFLSETVGHMLDDLEPGALLRMTYVLVALTLLIALYVAVKMFRFRRDQSRGLRRYDVLSAKELQPELIVDSESDEDELFTSHRPANDTKQLILPGSAN